MATTKSAMSPPTTTLNYHIGRLGPAKWNKINKAEDEELRTTLFRTCREAVNTPFPLGPFPAVIVGHGWVRLELDPDLPLPYLRIQNGYELKLEVPKKTKFFKVYVFKERFDGNKVEMVVPKKPTLVIHLSTKKVKQIILDEKENWPKYKKWWARQKYLNFKEKGLLGPGMPEYPEDPIALLMNLSRSDSSAQQTSEDGKRPQRSKEATTRRYHGVESRGPQDPIPIAPDFVPDFQASKKNAKEAVGPTDGKVKAVGTTEDEANAAVGTTEDKVKAVGPTDDDANAAVGTTEAAVGTTEDEANAAVGTTEDKEKAVGPTKDEAKVAVGPTKDKNRKRQVRKKLFASSAAQETTVILKCPVPHELQTEYKMAEIKLSRAQKEHGRASNKVKRLIHKEEWNDYARKEPTCAAFAAFQALDPKKQLKMACAAFEMLSKNDRTDLARDFRESALDYQKTTRDAAHKKMFEANLELVKIKDKQDAVRSTVSLGTVTRRKRDRASNSDDDFEIIERPSRKVTKKGPPKMKKVSKKKVPKKKGPKKKVPKGPKVNVPNKDDDVNVPNKDDDVTPILAADGEEYTPEPHWIRSARSSSQFKGVSYDRTREQWRVKVGNRTLKRCSSLSVACETFYNYSYPSDRCDL